MGKGTPIQSRGGYPIPVGTGWGYSMGRDIGPGTGVPPGEGMGPVDGNIDPMSSCLANQNQTNHPQTLNETLK